ncbi:vacuolar sorting protein 9 domain [Striga asiatica]|uniref:Vacuolar sorting protein 9 domain n=1 Tax=Striga asiatica TaxID=4170 RepID=A0A5A7P3T5_STRAF|nr:vacuolar sorting protein 9 domain [Striga asiatica]
METPDMPSSSSVTLTWQDFLERMRHPSAADFVKAIKSFIVSILINVPDAERDSVAVQQFFSNMEAAFRAHRLWSGYSEADLESAGEGLEKYVMAKLFTRVFASSPEDIRADEQLHEKIALLQQFIRPENLDLKTTFQDENSWVLAQQELQKIGMYKAPRDKLVCILKCCKVISNLLINASRASNEDHPGADDFLPVLIYVTIKANPAQLHSNLAYIQRFRRQTHMVAEAAYFFTNMLSVVSFIMNIDAKALSMDETEFQKNMESAREHLSESSEIKSRKNDERFKKDRSSSLDKNPSIPDIENEGVFRDFPFLYSQTGDLTVGDVEDLLNSYKQLVFKYVCLTKGLGLEIQTQNPQITREEYHPDDGAEENRVKQNIS